MNIKELLGLAILHEAEKKKEEHEDREKFKMHHVGSGWGKGIGSLVPGIAGAATIPIGHYIGREMPDKPEKEIDKKKGLHRTGVLLDKSHSLKTLKHGAIGAGLGALSGAAIAAIAHHHGHDLDHEQLKAAAGGGAALGGLLGGATGYAAKGMIDRHKAAKDLGYGHFGRIASAITPLAGFAKPKEQTDAEEKAEHYRKKNHNMHKK